MELQKTKYGIRKNKMQELLNDLFIKVDNRYYGAKRKLDSVGFDSCIFILRLF